MAPRPPIPRATSNWAGAYLAWPLWGCPTLEDEGGRVPSIPGEVVPSASFPPTQPRTPTLSSFSQDYIPRRHSGSVPEEPRAQKAAGWVDLEAAKLTQSHCGWKHCYRLWCKTFQSRETPRMTSRFPWKVRTRRNPRGRRWGPIGEGSLAWHSGLQEQEQGRRKEGVCREAALGSGPPRTHPPAAVGHHCSQQGAVQLSSPPSSVGVERGVMVGQFSGKSPDQEKSVSKADEACRVSCRDEGEL